jgi:ABC-type multidrug transport system permease subunit
MPAASHASGAPEENAKLQRPRSRRLAKLRLHLANIFRLMIKSIPVLLVMMLLSGSTTPMESMPAWLAHVMNVISPTPHFVVFAQDVLYRGADFPIVWTEILATFVIGSVYFGVALYRFRRVIFSG